MIEETEENIRRKKDKKFSKHYDILINDQKVKILNYHIKDYATPTENGRVIELISQLKFDKADRGDVCINIVTAMETLTVRGVWKFAWDGPGNYGVAYLIQEISASQELPDTQ